MTDRGAAARKLAAVTAIAFIGLFLAWFAVAWWLFVSPQQQPLHQADAVVSLAPASERLPAALEAYEDGLAPRLWVSTFPLDFDPVRGNPSLSSAVCDANAPDAARITCFTPASDSTIGEAMVIARLVDEAQVSSIVVATHPSHAARAQFLLAHCLPPDTEVQILLVDEPSDGRGIPWRMVYETGAFLKAFVEVGMGGC